MSQTGEVGEEGKEGDDPVAEATPSGSNFLDSFDIETSLSKDKKFQIEATGKESKRIFKNSFTRKQLIECGFPRKFSLTQCAEVVEGALNGTQATSISAGFVETAEAAQDKGAKSKKDDDDGDEDADEDEEKTIVDLREKYQAGDRLVFVIIHDLHFFKASYILSLKEVAQEDLEILQAQFDDLKKQVVQVTQRNIQLEKQVEDLTERVEARFSRPPQIGSWQSSTNSGDYKVWNHVLVPPPPGLFTVPTSDSKITIKKTGIYRIHTLVSANDGSVRLRLNGSDTVLSWMKAGDPDKLTPIHCVLKLNSGDELQVYLGTNGKNNRIQNFLSLEKLD